jgi:hypothetical protein
MNITNIDNRSPENKTKIVDLRVELEISPRDKKNFTILRFDVNQTEFAGFVPAAYAVKNPNNISNPMI